MPIAKTLLIAVLVTALSQCAGGPAVARKVSVEKGTRALVSLQQATVNLTVVNGSALTRAQAAAARRADPSLKIIPDAQVQLLLDRLGGLQFFARSTAVADPDATTWLTAIVGGKKYVLSGRAPRNDYAAMQHFNECLNQFRAVYNNNDSFKAGQISPGDFRRASESVNSEARGRRGTSKRP